MDAGSDASSGVPDAGTPDASTGTGSIAGFTVTTGTWNFGGGTYHAQARVTWTGGAPASHRVYSCTSGATCNITGTGNPTTMRVDVGPADDASWIVAAYDFASPGAIHGVVFAFDGTAPAPVPTIYPPGPYDRVQFLLDDGSMEPIPTLACDPPDPYYYDSVSVTITCTW